MDAIAFAQWCQQTAIAGAIRDSAWLFPLIEGVHLLALALLGGTVLLGDLQLAGFGFDGQRPEEVARGVSPWLHGALIAIVVSGVLLFMSQAVGYAANVPFRVKVAALVAAVIFSLVIKPRLIVSGSARAHKAIAVVSVALWASVGVAGRAIGFW